MPRASSRDAVLSTWNSTACFPDDVYQRDARRPCRSRRLSYRMQQPRRTTSCRTDRDTRVKIDLFPEYIRHLPAEQAGGLGRSSARAVLATTVKPRSCASWRRRSARRSGRLCEGRDVSDADPDPRRARLHDQHPYRSRTRRASPCSSICRATSRSRTSARSSTRSCPTAAGPP